MLFRIDTDGKAARAVPADSFSDLSYHERYNIQEWVLHHPDLLGASLMIIMSEFSVRPHLGASRRPSLDRGGRLVVVELKRTATIRRECNPDVEELSGRGSLHIACRSLESGSKTCGLSPEGTGSHSGYWRQSTGSFVE